MSIKQGARQVLSEELEALKAQIIKHHFDAGQKASGQTAASLHVEATDYEGTLWGRKGFGVLETGRRAGKVPAGFQTIIRRWMESKGIQAAPIPYKTDRPHKYTPQQRGDMQLSYLIARKIQKQGTKLFRSGGRSDIYSDIIPKATERIRSRIFELLKVEVHSIKINKEVDVE